MRVVADQLEVFELELADVFDARIQFYPRQRPACAVELFARLFEVIVVKMQIAERVDEIAGRKIDSLRDHRRQQGVTGDVEGDADKQIGAALVKLTA